jgi:hypothetical protein
LSRSTSPNISEGNSRNNQSPPARRVPRRDELDRCQVRLLLRGGPTKADLRLVDVGEGPLVVKDFAGKPWWVRLVGRYQIRRECAAYTWLGPREGLVGFVGRIDAHALALVWVDATQLDHPPRVAGDGPERLRRLREIVADLHSTGLVHLDLRGRENAIIDNHGRVFVLDLASALMFRPGGMAHRLFFERLATTDQAALLKWKRLLDAGEYTEEEQAFLRRFGFWRSLWIFNRKR